MWLGSAMVYEFESRAALDDFFKDEPYCTHGIYQKIDIYDWQRGVMAGSACPSPSPADAAGPTLSPHAGRGLG